MLDRISESSATLLKLGLTSRLCEAMFSYLPHLDQSAFFQNLTIARNKAVLSTTAEIGLTSACRLPDVVIEELIPVVRTVSSEELEFYYGTGLSPFGHCFVLWMESGIVGFSFVDGHEDGKDLCMRFAGRYRCARFRTAPEEAMELINHSFAALRGEAAKQLSVVLMGTPFQLAVWQATLQIPFGSLVSYDQLALAIGRPSASRAVGNALGANPVTWLVPCHRVIRRNGTFSSYGGGVERKIMMIGAEAALSE